jgi:hypothetical protein
MAKTLYLVVHCIDIYVPFPVPQLGNKAGIETMSFIATQEHIRYMRSLKIGKYMRSLKIGKYMRSLKISIVM